MIIKRLFLVGLAAVVLAACSGDSKVGTGVDTSIAGGDGGRLGETTTSIGSAAPVDTAPTTAAPTTAPPTTARPTPTTAAAAPAKEVEITVAGYVPQNPRVYVGQQVRFTNKEEETRTVNAVDKSFTSGPITTGKSWIFQTDRPGRYDIVDGDRPSVTGVIEVLAR